MPYLTSAAAHSINSHYFFIVKTMQSAAPSERIVISMINWEKPTCTSYDRNNQ